MGQDTTEREGGLTSSGEMRSGLFVCNGEYWTLGYEGLTFSLKDTRGLRYLQYLLQRPGEETSALELLSPPGTIVSTTATNIERQKSSLPIGINIRHGLVGDAGEMLDEKAKEEYKRRIRELKEEQEDLSERGDYERTEEIESEIEFLTRELSRALDFRGRDRRTGSISERARLNVRRAIKAALDKIANRHPTMGALLEQTIRTGTFCSYAPNKYTPVTWKFAELDLVTATGLAERQHPEVSASEAEPDFWREQQPASPLAHFSRGHFVGRSGERELIRKFIRAANYGSGSVVTIGGPPGIGKTRLVAELAAEAVGKMRILLGRCFEQEAIVPYGPFIEVLEIILEQTRSLEDFRALLGTSGPELTRMMPQLRRLFPALESPLEGTPEQQRRNLIKNFCSFVESLTHHHPVMLILEDLHWADQSTLDLLENLVSRVAQTRLMLVATYRDQQSDISGRFAQTLETLRRGHLEHQVHLRGLSPSDVAELIQRIIGKEMKEDFVREICRETDGNPFFIEEVLRYLLEEKRLFDDQGNVRPDISIGETEVPRSVRLTIERMLMRLNTRTRHILEFAAVLGARFCFDDLVSIQLFAAEELLDATKEGEDAGILISDPEAYENELGFSHELIRQTLLAGLSLPRRQRWHFRVAERFEQKHTASLEDHAGELAYHFTQAGPAGDPVKTLHYLTLAGKRALKVCDYPDAIRKFEKALGFIGRSPREDRLRIELDIKTAMHVALIESQGFVAPELEPLTVRMLELCDSVDDPRVSLAGFLSAWAFRSNLGELDQATAISQRMLRLAERGEFPLLELAANLSYGTILLAQGNLLPARAHLERATSLYSPQFAGQLHTVHDPGVVSFCYLSTTLINLGYADQALAVAARAVELAERISDEFTLVHAHLHVAGIHLMRGEGEQVLRRAEIISSLSEENGYLQYSILGTIMRGFAHTEMGQVGEGIAEVQAGLAKSARIGPTLFATGSMALLARAYLKDKQKESALGLIAYALNVAERTGERLLESQLYLLKGEALLLEPGNAMHKDAEAMFRKASQLAGTFGQDFSALRAAISMYELCKRGDRGPEARAELQQVYNRFTEGFEIADMKQARELLQG